MQDQHLGSFSSSLAPCTQLWITNKTLCNPATGQHFRTALRSRDAGLRKVSPAVAALARRTGGRTRNNKPGFPSPRPRSLEPRLAPQFPDGDVNPERGRETEESVRYETDRAEEQQVDIDGSRHEGGAQEEDQVGGKESESA